MPNFNMLALADCPTDEIARELENCRRIIAAKPPLTVADNAFWKAVENRLKLTRELVVRGGRTAAAVPLPADRLPLIIFEAAAMKAEVPDAGRDDASPIAGK